MYLGCASYALLYINIGSLLLVPSSHKRGNALGRGGFLIVVLIQLRSSCYEQQEIVQLYYCKFEAHLWYASRSHRQCFEIQYMVNIRSHLVQAIFYTIP